MSKEYIREAYEQGIPLKEIAATLNTTVSAIKSRANRDPECPTHGSLLHNGVKNENGIIKEIDLLQGVNAMREPTKADMSRLRAICEERGLPFEKWGIWWDKTKDSSIAFYNKEAVEEQKNLHAAMIADMKSHAPKYPTVKYGRVKDGHMKLIDIADLHISKYAISRDGSVAYDIETATSRAHQAVESMLTRTQGFPTEKFLFPIGNDVLHVDNKNNTTTKGTRQDVQGMWWEGYRAAKKMYVEVLERLLAIAPVEVIFNKSNHDEHLGFTLADALESHFRHCKGIKFTIEPQNDRQYLVYGRNLLGFDHGHGAKDAKLPLLMAFEAAEHWGKNQNRYLFRHHLHHWIKREYVAGEDHIGVTLQYMRSPSAPDQWHADSGYTGSPQAIDAFVFHPEHGQIMHVSCVFTT